MPYLYKNVKTIINVNKNAKLTFNYILKMLKCMDQC